MCSNPFISVYSPEGPLTNGCFPALREGANTSILGRGLLNLHAVSTVTWLRSLKDPSKPHSSDAITGANALTARMEHLKKELAAKKIPQLGEQDIQEFGVFNWLMTAEVKDWYDKAAAPILANFANASNARVKREREDSDDEDGNTQTRKDQKVSDSLYA